MAGDSGIRDIAGGVPMLLLGAAGLWFGRGYRFGTLTEMGPGFMPAIVSALLVATGAAICIGRRIPDPVNRLALRGVVFVFAAMAAFGLTIERLGLVTAIAAATAICAYATPEARWREVVAMAVGFASFAVIVFVYGLGQPVPVWWWDQ